MPIDPKKSREAHTEIGQRDFVAASISAPLANPPAPGMRDPQLASCRGDDASQPLPRGDVVELPPRQRRRVPATPALAVHRTLDRHPNQYRRFIANDRYSGQQPVDPAFGGKTGIVVMLLVAAFIGVLLATGGIL